MRIRPRRALPVVAATAVLCLLAQGSPAQTGGPTLTVRVAGAGAVASDPRGIACEPVCSAPFPRTRTGPQVVTLTATPAPGQQLEAWGEGCSGVATTCTVVMSADRVVTARFRPTPPGRAARAAGQRKPDGHGLRRRQRVWSGHRLPGGLRRAARARLVGRAVGGAGGRLSLRGLAGRMHRDGRLRRGRGRADTRAGGVRPAAPEAAALRRPRRRGRRRRARPARPLSRRPEGIQGRRGRLRPARPDAARRPVARTRRRRGGRGRPRPERRARADSGGARAASLARPDRRGGGEGRARRAVPRRRPAEEGSGRSHGCGAQGREAAVPSAGRCAERAAGRGRRRGGPARLGDSARREARARPGGRPGPRTAAPLRGRL